jgi:ABC-type uncharacterized transport system fused permease/ATPase subunit
VGAACRRKAIPGRIRDDYTRFWQSARVFWHGRRSWGVWLVTALLIAIVLVQLLVQYRLNLWNRDFFNALGRRDGAALWSEAQIFLPLAAASILPKERRALWFALRQVIVRWRDLARQLVQTTLVSQGNVLLAPVVAWILCAPKYLAGTMSLGELTQAAAAFVIVQGAFNWLVDNYQRLADWRSAVNRLATLLLALDDLCADQNARPGDQALGATNKVPP